MARQWFERALAMAQADGASERVAIALSNLGLVAKHEGRYEDALAHYSRALAMERERGRHAAAVRILGCLGGLHLAREDFEAARQASEEGLRLSKLHHIDFFVPIHAGVLGQALIGLGQLGDAERHLRLALEQNHRVGNPVVGVGVTVELARVALRLNDLEVALDRLRNAGRAARDLGLPIHCLDVTVSFGEWLREKGECVDAARIWSMVVEHAQADAGSRSTAKRWLDKLLLAPTLQRQVERAPITLATAMDWLLSGRPPVDDHR